eukprot:IDg21103t1
MRRSYLADLLVVPSPVIGLTPNCIPNGSSVSLRTVSLVWYLAASPPAHPCPGTSSH